MPVNLSGKRCFYTDHYRLNFGMNTEQMHFYLVSNSALPVDLATGVKSLGAKEAQGRVLKAMWNAYGTGRGRVQAWEFDD